jgi:hypothetical protein
MITPNKDLCQWLEIATDKLALPAKERIRSEIQAHFDEAIQNHIRDGSYEASAKTAALRELGEAGIAARRFRKQHLTEEEAELIEKLLKSARSPRWILLGGATFTLFVYILHLGRWYSYLPVPALSLLAVGCWIYPTIHYLIAKFSIERQAARRLLLMEAAMYYVQYTLPLFMPLLYCRAAERVAVWIIVLPSFVITAMFLTIKVSPRLKLWLKLWKMEDITADISSRGTLAS